MIEILVVVAIVGVLAAIMLVALGGAHDKARDSARKAEVSSFGRFLTLGCYVPDAGAGDYDLAEIIAELRVKYPQYSQQLSRVPQDPKGGGGDFDQVSLRSRDYRQMRAVLEFRGRSASDAHHYRNCYGWRRNRYFPCSDGWLERFKNIFSVF